MCICVSVYLYMYTWMRKKAYNSFPKPKAAQIIRDTPAANEDSYSSWIYVHNLWSSIQFLYFIVWKPSTWVSRCFPPFFLEVLLVFPMRPHPWFQFVKCQQLRQVGMVGPDSALEMCLEFGKRVALVSEAIALMCERIFVILMVQYMLSSHMVRGCPVSGFLAVVDLAFTGCEGQSWPFRQAIQEALGQKQPELPQVGMFCLLTCGLSRVPQNFMVENLPHKNNISGGLPFWAKLCLQLLSVQV